MASIRILPLNATSSDGDGRKWPKHGYIRNDDYFQRRIATDFWAKDLLPEGPDPGVTYRLDRMPQGYAGFERAWKENTAHIDRFIYGHQNGQFRSLVEFYPHFKHLMDHGGPSGCKCKLCSGGRSKSQSSGGNGRATSTQRAPSRHFVKRNPASETARVALGELISPYKYAPGRGDSPISMKRRKVDHEGTADVYELFIQRLKDAGPGVRLSEQVHEATSPDWQASNTHVTTLLQQWKDQPRFVPRVGEVVLFVRHTQDQALLSQTQPGQPPSYQLPWEAGVVIQTPQEPLSTSDLTAVTSKSQSITYTGFRIEPLSAPGQPNKPWSKQYKHIPLHALRPFSLWKECLKYQDEGSCHPTIKHALTVACAVNLIGRHRFDGVWPTATVSCSGAYIGHELILVGDLVRLLPRPGWQATDKVTDVMEVTAITLRFVNLDFEDDDLAPLPPELPYQTALHVTGKVYTLDPKRAFRGAGSERSHVDARILGQYLSEYEKWFHYTDPARPSARVELPFSRILGRCYEPIALSTWLPSPANPSDRPHGNLALSSDLSAVISGRNYARIHDRRLAPQAEFDLSRQWLWADSRIEALDLHEVNNRNVGVKNEAFRREGWVGWVRLLKGIKDSGEEEKKGKDIKRDVRAGSGMLAVRGDGDESSEVEERAEEEGEREMMVEREDEGTGEEGDEEDEVPDEEEDELEILPSGIEDIIMNDANEDDDDQDEDEAGPSQLATGFSQVINLADSESDDDIDEQLAAAQPPTRLVGQVINLADSEDEAELANNKLVGEFTKNFRSGGMSR